MKLTFLKYFKLVSLCFWDVVQQGHRLEPRNYLFIAIVGLQFVSGSGWNLRDFGEDCEPIWKNDAYLLNKIKDGQINDPEFLYDFGKGAKIGEIPSNRWTRTMQNIYTENIISLGTTCNIMKLLDCSLKWNANKDSMTKHHHHSKGTKGLHGEEILEDRDGTLIIANNPKNITKEKETEFQSVVLQFDPRLEGRCVCNPDFSINHSVEVNRRGKIEHIDKCLGIIGTPCQYHPAFFDFSYLKSDRNFPGRFPDIDRRPIECIPKAKCLSISDRIIWDKQHDEPKEPIHMDDSIEDVIEDMLGFRFRIPGVRAAYKDYLMRYVTHLCQCEQGYKANGNKECIRDYTVSLRTANNGLKIVGESWLVKTMLMLAFIMIIVT